MPIEIGSQIETDRYIETGRNKDKETGRSGGRCAERKKIAKDTDAIDSRDLKVIDQLNHRLSIGV